MEYTQPEKTKLETIAEGAQVNVGQEFTQAEKDKVLGIEQAATADQTPGQIVDAIDQEIGDQWKDVQFIDQDDTPDSYTGQAGKYPQVNVGETGLDFVDAPTGGGSGGSSTFEGLTDTAPALGAEGTLAAITGGVVGFVDSLTAGQPPAAITALARAATQPWARDGFTGTIDPAFIATGTGNVVGVNVHQSMFSAVSSQWRAFTVPWVLPLVGKFQLEFLGVDLHTLSTPMEASLIRALPPLTVTGDPIGSSDAITPANHLTVRLPGTNLPRQCCTGCIPWP